MPLSWELATYDGSAAVGPYAGGHLLLAFLQVCPEVSGIWTRKWVVINFIVDQRPVWRHASCCNS